MWTREPTFDRGTFEAGFYLSEKWFLCQHRAAPIRLFWTILISVTRLGKISPKFAKVYKSLVNFWQFTSYLAKCLAYFGNLWHFGLIFIVAIGHILNNMLTIWSHWFWFMILCCLLSFFPSNVVQLFSKFFNVWTLQGKFRLNRKSTL